MIRRPEVRGNAVSGTTALQKWDAWASRNRPDKYNSKEEFIKNALNDLIREGLNRNWIQRKASELWNMY